MRWLLAQGKCSAEMSLRPNLAMPEIRRSVWPTPVYWPVACFPRPSQIMQNIFTTIVISWMAVVSLLIVAYLTSLTIEEKRRNRQMNAKRQRLGLSA
jgi:hypothetical protein